MRAVVEKTIQNVSKTYANWKNYCLDNSDLNIPQQQSSFSKNDQSLDLLIALN